MKKTLASLLLVLVVLTALPVEGFTLQVHAESLGLSSAGGWRFASNVASTRAQADKVYRLAASRSSAKVASRLYDLFYTATYRPAITGGSNWGYGVMTSVYDRGLGTKVNFRSAQGCFAYANFVSQYTHGTTGTKIRISQLYPTTANIRTFVETCFDPGEHFHFFNTVYGREHSFIYLAHDANGMYVLSSSAGSKIYVFYCTYEKLRGILRYDNGTPIVLYDTDGDHLPLQANAAANHTAQSSVSPSATPSDPSQCKVAYRRALRSGSGMKGDDVRYVQVCLRYLGYSLTADGQYGSGTASVVRKFQKDYKVTPYDGVCGSGTWKALEAAVAAKKKASENPPSAVSPASQKKVASVAVKTNPAKTDYYVGESFQSKGMKLRVTYKDGSTQVVSSGFTCSPSGKFTKDGRQKVKVTYQGKTTSVTVFVTKKVSSISVGTKPAKTDYHIGEEFSSKGMTVKVNYTDGTHRYIDKGFSTATDAFTWEGLHTVKVHYEGKIATFKVSVTKPVASVSVASRPAKTDYAIGECFSPKGMSLKVVYTDGSFCYTDRFYTYSPAGKFTRAGQHKMTFTYGGKSATLVVNVARAVSSVSVASKPDRTEYAVGESFSSRGLTLKVHYNDGTSAVIDKGFTCSAGRFTKDGHQKVKVTYQGRTASVTVNVTKPVASVSVASKPARMNYHMGERFASKGMTLKVFYTDGTSRYVDKGFTTETDAFNWEGMHTVRVHYQGKTTYLRVLVTKPVASVSVGTQPQKLYYNVGESFFPKGMTLKISYTDGSSRYIDKDYTYTPVRFAEPGMFTVTVTYGDCFTDLYVWAD